MSEKELIIVDEVVGHGKEIVRGALVLADYEGYLSDGTMFDSSKERGRPFQFVFGTGRVIKGWDQGLIGMKEGGRRKLTVPSALAYGERQIGSLIKPHSDLYFLIYLIEVRTRD
jgi:peptidylprolyl isomerase